MSSALLARLAEIVGDAHVLCDAADTAAHLTDWRGRYHGRALAVVRPADVAQVAAVVRACAAARVPVVPQGGNTGLVGGATPGEDGRAVVMLTQRLARIRAVDAANDTLTVEAGCTLAAVQQAARDAGRLFPLSLASEGSCTIGGNLASNAGGVQVLRYGNARELCLGLEVVLPGGDLWDGLRGLRKDNAGLDLKQLFIGSEGTLGIITAAVLRLVPLPTARTTAWLALDSVDAALALLAALRARFPGRVDSFELISRPTLELTLAKVERLADPLPGSTAPWRVLLELTDGGGSAVLAEALAETLCAVGHTTAVLAQSDAQRQALWRIREAAPEAEKRAGFSVKHDISLPLSRLADFLAATDAALAAAYPGSTLICFGHLGDGNLHYNLSHPDPAFLDRQPAINELVFDAVALRGGSIAAEHGVGQLRRQQLLRYRTPLELALMRELKKTIDPLDLMNPGKLYPQDSGAVR